jgi:hypothetical protein
MMMPDPSGVIVMPPVGVVPRMMVVPITIVVARVCDHWRKREQRGQRCGAEYRSKFHSWYLLAKSRGKGRGNTPTGSNTKHR